MLCRMLNKAQNQTVPKFFSEPSDLFKGQNDGYIKRSMRSINYFI